MKKSNKILCILLAAVMLLGAVPAQAATPMTAAALFALPITGKLFSTGPISDRISKALTVSKPAEPAPAPEPTPAPAETPAAAATNGRLPDGTSGATIPAGLIVDVYEEDIGQTISTFVCQYDTRDGKPLTITAAPSAYANVPTPSQRIRE